MAITKGVKGAVFLAPSIGGDDRALVVHSFATIADLLALIDQHLERGDVRAARAVVTRLHRLFRNQVVHLVDSPET